MGRLESIGIVSTNSMRSNEMVTNGFRITDFVQLIDAFANVVALEEGGNVHEQTIQSGCESNVFVG